MMKTSPQMKKSLLPVCQLVLMTLASLSGLEAAPAAAAAADKENEKPGIASTKNFEAECLRQHNKWRRLHRASPLKIDAKLVKFARERAQFIADSDGVEFRHPDNLEFGENLAWNSDSSSSCAKLIKMWYDEVKLYSFKDAVFTHESGHFTQLVWRDTKRVGCGRAFSSGPRGGVFLVCNYDPAGNYSGEFSDNVKRAKKQKKKQPKKKQPAATSSELKESPSTTTSTSSSTTTTQKPASGRSISATTVRSNRE